MEAEALEDPVRRKGVLRVISQEEQRSIWRTINRVTDPPCTGVITHVQRMEGGSVVNLCTLDEMTKEIQEVIEKRFALAESASALISSLRQSVGYLADTEFAKDLLEGRAEIPDDVDEKTSLILQELQRLCQLVRGAERDSAFEVTGENYSWFWSRVRERTSSSYSGAHFGHGKAASKSKTLSDFFARKITFVGRTGLPPSRWGTGLQVMLEKVAGVALVNKLRAILLLETDYNFFNKWPLAGTLSTCCTTWATFYVPAEQYSQRELTAEDARLDSLLTMDISRQHRQPLVAISADADKCYDRINHIIMSLLLLTVVGSVGLMTALLHPIQTMKFYQRTAWAWGDSSMYMGGRTRDNPPSFKGYAKGMGRPWSVG